MRKIAFIQRIRCAREEKSRVGDVARHLAVWVRQPRGMAFPQARVQAVCSAAAASVLCKSMAMVKGPTPPGTGVM